MLVSVGSASNADNPDTHPNEFHRADVLEFTLMSFGPIPSMNRAHSHVPSRMGVNVIDSKTLFFGKNDHRGTKLE